MQDNFSIHGWRLSQSLNETEKIKGKDGKGCWKGYRYAGTENGKDKCIPVKENTNLTVNLPDFDSQAIAYKISDALLKAGYNRDIIKLIAKAILTRPSLQEGKQLCKECGAGYMEEGQCMECGYMEEGFPDLSGDGKITQKDILIGKGVIKKEGADHEVSMAQASLKSIVAAASELISKIGDEEFDIPGWIQDHITNSENYISQANKGYHKLEPSFNTSELQEGISEADKAEQALYTYLKGEVKGLNYSKIKSYVLDIKQASRQEGYDECRDDNAY